MLLRRLGPLAVVLFAALCVAAVRGPNRFGESYLIRRGDELQITVTAEPDLSGWVSVRRDGSVTIPLVGSTQAAGQTLREFRLSLTEKLAKFLRTPRVRVDIGDKTAPPARSRKWLSPPERPTPFPPLN